MADRFPSFVRADRTYIARVDTVRPGESSSGVSDSDQWVADVTICNSESPVGGCRVIGNCLPMSHTADRPSYGLVGFCSGDHRQPWIIPIGWASFVDGVKDATMIQEFDKSAITVTGAGVFSIETRPGGEVVFDESNNTSRRVGEQSGDNIRTLSVDGTSVRAFNGAHRVARGGSDGGDKIAITNVSSPGLAAWMQSVSTALTQTLVALAAISPAPAVGPLALTAETAGLLTGAKTALGNAVAALASLPMDAVPAKDDQAAQPASGTMQIVGEIRTGTSKLRSE